LPSSETAAPSGTWTTCCPPWSWPPLASLTPALPANCLTGQAGAPPPSPSLPPSLPLALSSSSPPPACPLVARQGLPPSLPPSPPSPLPSQVVHGWDERGGDDRVHAGGHPGSEAPHPPGDRGGPAGAAAAPQCQVGREGGREEGREGGKTAKFTG
jgi:hypothetical protein